MVERQRGKIRGIRDVTGKHRHLVFGEYLTQQTGNDTIGPWRLIKAA
ncbi:MAG: hypothetical protein R3E84_06605 [Pseudomonadales bacterium]